LHQYNSYPRTF
nr:immunoglobulin light chain junction region [Macaca mulatta]